MSTESKIIAMAKKDADFMTEIKSEQMPDVPGFFSSKTEKSLFATMYLGYLIGVHGAVKASQMTLAVTNKRGR